MIKLLPLAALALASAFAADTRFEISFPAAVNAGPVTGRVYIMITRPSAENAREPRLEIGRVGVPFFGRDVEKLGAGQSAIIDATDLGSPVAHLGEIPPGEYYVQG